MITSNSVTTLDWELKILILSIIDPRFIPQRHADVIIINAYLGLVYADIKRHYNMTLAAKDVVTPHLVKKTTSTRRPR